MTQVTSPSNHPISSGNSFLILVPIKSRSCTPLLSTLHDSVEPGEGPGGGLDGVRCDGEGPGGGLDGVVRCDGEGLGGGLDGVRCVGEGLGGGLDDTGDDDVDRTDSGGDGDGTDLRSRSLSLLERSLLEP